MVLAILAVAFAAFIIGSVVWVMAKVRDNESGTESRADSTELVPSNDVIERGATMMLGASDASRHPYRRGDTLVSRGMANIPYGTLVYPVKFGDYIVLYYAQDEFGDWVICTERASRTHKIDLRDAEAAKPAVYAALKKAAEEKGVQLNEQDKEFLVRKAREAAAAGKELNQETIEDIVTKIQSQHVIDENRKRDGDEFRKRGAEIQAQADAQRTNANVAFERKEPEALARETAEEELAENKATVARSQEKDRSLTLQQLREERAKLDRVNGKIESERKRWSEALNVINTLTNNKRTAVKEGTPAFFKCQAASEVIKEVEANAEALKADKANAEKTIQELERQAVQ